MKSCIIYILLSLCILKLDAKIILPSILGDNMVLQQNTEVNLWGKANPNSEVRIKTSWNLKEYLFVSNKNGEWIQKIETPQAGGPYEISISDGEEFIIKNVLIGEVWLCSGQSNMEHTMRGYRGQPTRNSLYYINKAKESRNIRIATIKRNYSTKKLNNCETAWLNHSPESVKSSSAVAYFFANYLEDILNVPVGIICASWGGSRIESWIDKNSLKEFNPQIDLSVLSIKGEIDKPNIKPTLLFNAMISPISNYKIRGVLWYQGEANRNSPKSYTDLQIRMMNLWRDVFDNENMPFYYVQIAPYLYTKENGFTSGFFYEAQSDIMNKDSNCGMVSTIDIGDMKEIHPKYKQEVGNRLAYWALAKTYGRKVAYHGPTYKSMRIVGNKIILDFNLGDSGLWCPNDTIIGFELASEDKHFVPAEAVIKNRKTIEVYSDKVIKPIAVRYCFRDYSPGCIYNNYQLPLAPFRTDDWDQ